LNKQERKDSANDIVVRSLNEMVERGRIAAEMKLKFMEISNAREEERIRVEQSIVRADEDKIIFASDKSKS
jgi:hypothetical protein